MGKRWENEISVTLRALPVLYINGLNQEPINLYEDYWAPFCLKYLMSHWGGMDAEAANTRLTPVFSGLNPALHYSKLYHLRPNENI